MNILVQNAFIASIERTCMYNNYYRKKKRTDYVWTTENDAANKIYLKQLRKTFKRIFFSFSLVIF